MTAVPPTTMSGSTVHHGTYECECFNCWEVRNNGGEGKASRWSCWRLGREHGAGFPNRVVRGTWIMCDECAEIAASESAFGDLYLPLLHPSDPYARIAVEELLYSIAAFGAACAARTRVSSHPLCGWDVYGYGGRNPKKPCRSRATQLVADWLEVDGGDLYLCDRHAKTLKRRERDSGGRLETELVLDFGGSP
jgi:hypothetical protein